MNMRINFHDLQAQYVNYKDEIDAGIQKVLDSCQFIQGPEITEFEAMLADFLNCNHVITCASGTDALLLSLMAIDIKQDDEVITTPFTFIATAEVISLLGAKPVFVDIQRDTYNIDPEKIADKITPKTRAIIPVSLFGQPADMDEIVSIAQHYGERYGHQIYVIEDAAQSLGATYKGMKSANLSDMGCTSFFPSKPLGCYGDGGAITTNNHELANKIKSMRIHGQTKRYYHKYIGFNCRLDTIQAAILKVKLKYFSSEIIKRERIADNYKKLLSGMNIILPYVKPDRNSVYAQFSIRLKDRERIIEYLKANNIPTAVHYPLPLHMQECFKSLGYARGDFPIAELVSEEIMSLPMSAHVTSSQQEYIAEALDNALKINERNYELSLEMS